MTHTITTPIAYFRYLENLKKLIGIENVFPIQDTINDEDIKLIVNNVQFIDDSIFNTGETKNTDVYGIDNIHHVLVNKYKAHVVLYLDMYFTKDIIPYQFKTLINSCNPTTFFTLKIEKSLNENLETFINSSKQNNFLCLKGISFFDRFLNLKEGISTEGLEIEIEFWATEDGINIAKSKEGCMAPLIEINLNSEILV